MPLGVIVFHSTQHAIRAEKVLKQGMFVITTIPVPRHISTDCGIALRFDLRERDAILAYLQNNSVEIAGIHEL